MSSQSVSSARFKAMFWRFGCVSTAITAMFWLAWYFFLGSVPVTKEVCILPFQTLELHHFSYIRWLDIVFVPVWTNMTIFILLIFLNVWDFPIITWMDHEHAHEKLRVGLIGSLIAGGFLSIVIPEVSVLFVMILMSFGGLLIGILLSTPLYGIGFGIGCGWIAGFMFSIHYGFGIGLVIAKLVAITTCKAAGIGAMIRLIGKVKTWVTIWHWLIATQK